MNEQIIITMNDEGVELEVQFIDSKKKPINITDCTIEVAFKKPNGEVEQHQAYVIDYINGVAGTILDKSKTSIEGLWSTYWSAISEDGFVTAQEAVYYFVMPMYGGVNNEENS